MLAALPRFLWEYDGNYSGTVYSSKISSIYFLCVIGLASEVNSSLESEVGNVSYPGEYFPELILEVNYPSIILVYFHKKRFQH